MKSAEQPAERLCMFMYIRKLLPRAYLSRLHDEIENFFDYMAPTQTEHHIRGDVVYRIEKIVKSLWADAEVHVFGSFRTGLYLSTSDIDLVVLGKKSFCIYLIDINNTLSKIV